MLCLLCKILFYFFLNNIFFLEEKKMSQQNNFFLSFYFFITKKHFSPVPKEKRERAWFFTDVQMILKLDKNILCEYSKER